MAGPEYTGTNLGLSTATVWGASVLANALEENIQYELRPHRIYHPVMRKAPASNALTYIFNVLTDPGPTVTDVTESTPTDLMSSQITPTNQISLQTPAVVTTAQHGVSALVTDLVTKVSILDVTSVVSGALARTTAEAYDVAAQTAIALGSNSTGGASTGSMSRFLTAVAALEQRDVGSDGENLVAGVHAKQFADIRADALTTTATFMAGDQNAKAGDTLAASLQGYVGSLFSIPLFQTTTVTSSSGSYLGWVMAAQSAVGDYNLWLDKVALQRDESRLSTEVIVSSCYGIGIIDNNRLQLLKSTT